MSKIRVLICGDCELYRMSLRSTLEASTFNVNVEELSRGEDLLAFEPLKHEIVLLDIGSKRYNGFRVALTLLKRNQKVRLILLVNDSDNPLLGDLIAKGARGLVTPYFTSKEILDAFRSVMIGDRYIFSNNDQSSKIARLTRNEFTLISLLAEGNSTREICEKMKRSAKTIETYRSRLLRKTNTRNTPHLLCLLYHNNIFGPDLAFDISKKEPDLSCSRSSWDGH